MHVAVINSINSILLNFPQNIKQKTPSGLRAGRTKSANLSKVIRSDQSALTTPAWMSSMGRGESWIIHKFYCK